MIIHGLVRAIANIAMVLDSSEESIDEDSVVEILEMLGADLQDLDEESRKVVCDAFRAIAPEYEGEAREFVETMPEAFGLEEEDED